MRYTIQYLGAGGAVLYETQVIAGNAREARVSARIGLGWAIRKYGAASYLVRDENGVVVESGPP